MFYAGFEVVEIVCGMEKEDCVDVNEQGEEYVLLNLDEVVGKVNIPPNAPYVLSVC